jgi:hypothetical protein
MKRCGKCNVLKPLEDFYRSLDLQMDGRAPQRFLQRRFKRRLEDFDKPSASPDRLSIPPSSLCQNDGLYRFDSETLPLFTIGRFGAVVMNPAFASSRVIPAGDSSRLRLTVCRQSLPQKAKVLT